MYETKNEYEGKDAHVSYPPGDVFQNIAPNKE